jgi:hypothetical protein
MTPLMFFTSYWYDIFPWASTLNLAVPVAVVLTGGVRLWPDKLALKLICCASTGIVIIGTIIFRGKLLGCIFQSGAAPIVSFLETFKTIL